MEAQERSIYDVVTRVTHVTVAGGRVLLVLPSLLCSHGEFLFLEIGRRCLSSRDTLDQSCVDLGEVDPNSMMATLILFLETQRAARDGEGSMIADLPVVFGTRRFQEPTYVRPFTWYTSWSHSGVGPGGNGKFVLTNASSVLLINRELLPD